MKKLPFAVAISAALLLAACGKEAPQASAPAAEAPKVETPAAEAPKVEAPAAAAAPAAEAPKAEATASVDGKSIYGKTCAMCHAAGVAGAPKPGDKEAWAPRIAQGNDTMYKHALEGFTGDHGMMPARGGNPKLTDEEVKAAVDFMAGQSV